MLIIFIKFNISNFFYQFNSLSISYVLRIKVMCFGRWCCMFLFEKVLRCDIKMKIMKKKKEGK
jgi:hypothetical protein